MIIIYTLLTREGSLDVLVMDEKGDSIDDEDVEVEEKRKKEEEDRDIFTQN